MSKVKFESTYYDGKNKISVGLGLYLWDENGIFYVYSPSLDLTGYGESAIKAKASFEQTLEEFLNYTQSKKTLFEELEHLGWAVNKKKKRVHAPDINDLLEDNESFRNIYEQAKKITKKVEFELA